MFAGNETKMEYIERYRLEKFYKRNYIKIKMN